jgi:hypothetical protein
LLVDSDGRRRILQVMPSRKAGPGASGAKEALPFEAGPLVGLTP